MAVVLAATGLFVYLQLRSNLDRTIDQSLRSRVGDISALVQSSDTGLSDAATIGPRGPAADVAQIVDAATGTVVDGTRGVGQRPLLTDAERALAARTSTSLDRPRIAVSDGPVRLLATPVTAQGRDLVIVVGNGLEDRDQALNDLATLLLTGGPGALLLATLAGYGLAAAALRPVEAMRRRAASITTHHLQQRLPLGPRPDELHRLGQTLNEMLTRLETGLGRERAFTADASHELRTPLTLLKTELELVARDHPSGADLDGAMGAAVDEADRLARLIDDLLVLARSDTDQLPRRPKRTSVERLLADVAARDEPPDGDPAILVDVPDGLAVDADPARLRQALTNMLDNALRHGRRPVRLTATAREGMVELHVHDDGPGLPPAFLDRAFERFARGDPGRGHGGTGLGLAIVRAIAQAEGGSAHIANDPGGGAHVWIAIPASARSAPPSTP